MTHWTHDEELIAFKLYCEIPFGEIRKSNEKIIAVASSLNRTPSSLVMRLSNFASLDPKIVESGRAGLANASKATKSVWSRASADWNAFLQSVSDAESRCNINPCIEQEKESSILQNHEGFTQKTIVQVRRGQDFFRATVLSAYNRACCISGLTHPSFLVASHIVPWRIDTKNRLNPRNGLCLSLLYDKAFDLGLLTIDENYNVMLSSLLKEKNREDTYLKTALLAYEGKPLRLPDKFPPDPELLNYHRTHIFKVA